jgi:cell division septum initiation protein DivIVA
MINAKELEDQFGVIERRIQAITSENRALKERIAELEREIAEARKEAQTQEHISGITGQVRERIEKVLLSLETIGTGKTDA